MSALGLLLIRLVFGLTFAAHGAQKLFGWFDGDGMDGTAKFFASVGLKPGRFHAALGGWEYNLAIITVAIGVALIGPGPYTVAALFR